MNTTSEVRFVDADLLFICVTRDVDPSAESLATVITDKISDACLMSNPTGLLASTT